LLDIKKLRNNVDEVKEAMRNRNEDPEQIEKIIKADSKRRELIKKTDELKAERNRLSKSVAKLKAAGKEEEANNNIRESKEVGRQI